MPTLADSLRESAAAVADLGGGVGSFVAMDAAQLMTAIRSIAELRRHVDQFAALAAGEVAHRSRRELGHQGVAQQAGFVNAVAMIQSIGQVSKHEATRLVEMGSLLTDVEHSTQLLEASVSSSVLDGGEAPIDAIDRITGVLAPAWHGLLAEAVGEGRMSLDKVDAIRRVMTDITGAGTDTTAVDDTAITAAVAGLISDATGSSPEQLYRAAKRARDVIDADGIARREK